MPNMNFDQMIDAYNKQPQPDAPEEPLLQSSFFGGGSVPAPAPAAQPYVPPQIYDHSAQIQGLPQAHDKLSSEQLRHQITQFAMSLKNSAPPSTGAPAAPPLEDRVGAPIPTAIPDGPDAAQLARGEINRGEAMDKYATTNLSNNLSQETAGIQQGMEADQKLNEVARRQTEEQNAIDASATAKAKEQEDRMQAIADRGQIAAEAQMKRVMSAADEASRAEIHNFWRDKSTGARILGVLAQAFSGAANGLAGNPSAPTPLDRVIQRDMELQQANLQQKNRDLENQRGVLRGIYDQTGSLQQATAAMYVASWKRISLQSAQLKTKFANETADAADEKVQALAKQRIADATNKTFNDLRNTSIQQQQHGINIMAETERTGAMGSPRESGENAKIYHLAGTKGAVDERTYKQFKDEDQNYRAFVKQAEHVDWLFKHGSGDNGADWQDYNGARSAMFATLRQMQKTGAALSDAELKNAEAMLPSLAKGEVPGLAWLTNARNMMTRIMATAGRGHFSMVDGSIEGVSLDPNDVRFGAHVTNYLREAHAQQAAAETDGAQ